MLLPSALPCDARVSRPRRTRTSAQSLFASPPTSDEETSFTSPDPQTRDSGIFSTCRALQSMLAPHLATPAVRQRGALTSPIVLGYAPTPQSRVHKPTPRTLRGSYKRRRLQEDAFEVTEDEQDIENQYTTPKRPRSGPEQLPLGLERSDFEALEPSTPSRQNEQQTTFMQDQWSMEDDHMLVELVLEKLQLSKSDWTECARTLGKDRGSIGRRWMDLVGEGSVGLKKKGKARRPRIDIRR